MTSLSESQLKKLFLLSQEAIMNSELDAPTPNEKEEAFTSRVVLPWLSVWAKSMNIDHFYVRGDGGPNPLALYWQSFTHFPDVTITEYSSKHIATEVKILRTDDDGGSLAKAIGQAVIYQKAGFKYSLALIFDIRNLSPINRAMKCVNLEQISEYTFVAMFKSV
jgi:hypothetical protein